MCWGVAFALNGHRLDADHTHRLSSELAVEHHRRLAASKLGPALQRLHIAIEHRGHHRAGHATVQQRAVPAAMHRAHRVAEVEGRGAAKHHAARVDRVQFIAEGGADGRAGLRTIVREIEAKYPGEIQRMAAALELEKLRCRASS